MATGQGEGKLNAKLRPKIDQISHTSREEKLELCADTGYSLEDLPGAMDDRNGWRESVREICAGSVT